MIPRTAVKRLSLVLWCALLFSAVEIGHLFRLQILKHETYLAEAERQHKQKIILPPKRGDILDCNGSPLAISAEGLNVYAIPDRIKNRKKTAALLARYLDLSENYISRRISTDRPFVMIRQKVNPLSLRELQEKNLEGIGFVPSSKRYYPRHSLAAQLIGYVGVDEVGLTGIEFSRDSELSGEPGWLVVQRDALGNPYNVLDYPLRRQTNGCHLRLTIEAEFQEIAEDALRRSVVESGAHSGCVVAVNPANGKILALANYPGVDLNTEDNFKLNDFLNLATNLPYEPGSTFKPFSGCALLASKHVTLKDTVFCENGTFKLRDRVIRDVHRYGKLSFRDVIAKSSNIGMAKLIQRSGNEELYRVLRDFGFGSYTGNAFSGEDRGVLPPPTEWSRATKTSLAIGYNLLVTPLQMAMAYAALANGGGLYEPALVEAVFNENGNMRFSFTPRMVRRVLEKGVIAKMTQAMIAVVDSGTGTAAAVPGFKVAGKTGTSMKANPQSGYGGNGYISSFGGFFPAESPQIAMYIMINDPDFKNRWGGTCAAPVFGEIIRNTLLSTSRVIDRARLGLPCSTVQTAAIASGESSSSRTGPEAPAISPADPSADSGAVTVPQLAGLSMRSAVARLAVLGLQARVLGGVRVLDQKPAPGTVLRRGGLCTLTGSQPVSDKSFSMITDSAPAGEQDARRPQNEGGRH